MLIVHVLTRFLKAGSEENTLHTCRAQLALGHEVILVHGRDYDRRYLERVKDAVTSVHEVKSLVHPLAPISDFVAIVELKRLLVKWRPDVVHTHQSKAGIIGRVAAYLAGTPVIIHGIHIVPFFGVGKVTELVYVAAEKLCARITSVFVSVSDSVRKSYVERRIGASERHCVAYSPIDLERYKTPVVTDELWGLIKAGDASKPAIVVMLAAFEPRKRHLELISALPRAFSSISDWRVVFAGAGELEAAAKKRAEELNIRDRVIFLGHRSDPEAVVGLADVCILTSEREGLPRVVVQYIAAGKAVVVNDVFGIEEIVRDGVNGIVVPVDHVAGVAEAAASLLKSPETRNRLSLCARTSDLTRWSKEQAVAATMSAYDKAIALEKHHDRHGSTITEGSR